MASRGRSQSLLASLLEAAVPRFLSVLTCVVVLSAGSARATTLTLSGYLNDSANSALVASDGYEDLQPARFGSDDEIARNVAIYELTVSTPALFTFESHGYAAGGTQPYFTIFQGNDTSATFVDSNYFSPDIDFTVTEPLAAGDYLLALGTWFNMSFAENNPDADPTLGDGFIALGVPGFLGTSYYELGVSADTDFRIAPAKGLAAEPVPEPTTLMLVGMGLASGALRKKRSAK
jgi:hypothetical protein